MDNTTIFFIYLFKESEDLQNKIAEISNHYPKLVKNNRKFNADPIVIALAETNTWTVVTQENPSKQNNIVGCCRNMQVKCIFLSLYVDERSKQLISIRQTLWGNNQ